MLKNKKGKGKKEFFDKIEAAVLDVEFIIAAMNACLDAGDLDKTGEVLICEAIKKADALEQFFGSSLPAA